MLKPVVRQLDLQIGHKNNEGGTLLMFFAVVILPFAASAIKTVVALKKQRDGRRALREDRRRIEELLGREKRKLTSFNVMLTRKEADQLDASGVADFLNNRAISKESFEQLRR